MWVSRILLIVMFILSVNGLFTKMARLNSPHGGNDESLQQIYLPSEISPSSDSVTDMNSLHEIVNYLQRYIEDIRKDEEGENTYERRRGTNRGRRDVSEQQHLLASNSQYDSTAGGCQFGSHFVGGYTPYLVGQYCFMCPVGAVGPRGSPGIQGSPGRDMASDSPENVDTSSSTDQTNPGDLHPTQGVNAGGVVYTRWGRRDCPVSSVLVYTGMAGGSSYNIHGGGANYLCLPVDPIYEAPLAGVQGTAVYASEYQVSPYPPMSHLHDSDVPCAVCQAVSRSSLIVIPARNVCPGQIWTNEYSGYLMTGHHSHKGRFEFVCMDQEAQVIERTSADTNGALFYVAESTCGSSGSGLPCPPYVGGYELTCAVCTM